VHLQYGRGLGVCGHAVRLDNNARLMRHGSREDVIAAQMDSLKLDYIERSK